MLLRFAKSFMNAGVCSALQTCGGSVFVCLHVCGHMLSFRFNLRRIHLIYLVCLFASLNYCKTISFFVVVFLFYAKENTFFMVFVRVFFHVKSWEMLFVSINMFI